MKIIFWHGYSVGEKKFDAMVEKLKRIGCITVNNDEKGSGIFQQWWYYRGTLAEFVDKWDDKFLAMKQDGDWLIGVTQYSNFGQR